ncbi:hypothetical protein HAD_08465 [Hyphomonas adhaerens MHS-3]|uniref:Uncharacterized protein n=1 Tax=Hyphomonas adhaerens MHS-3 TaxID=1280949 RepID=A0A069E6Z0_9PROT|nr:DUF2793 domain-containing protein [Hyphomonas adhaerens]KCZ85704.1 hypothetical protein HAD_08465 [Hyphomonas adhaerens MHS-3]
MSQTNRIGLGYLLPNQAQKHVTVNEAFARLDGLVQAAVMDAVTSGQPETPEEGQAWLVPEGATGAVWSAAPSGTLAVFRDGAWDMITPQAGWRVFDLGAGALKVFDGTAWQSLAGSGGTDWPLLGINTAADETQRLAVKSDAVLLSHDDVTPGSGDMRLFLNRADSGRTASILFEDDYTARAEFGLTGGPSVNLKVNLPVTGWADALSVDMASGAIGLGTTAPEARLDVAPGAGPLPPIPGAVVLRLLNDAGQQTTFIADAIANNGDLSMRRANGAFGALTPVQAGDNIGQISWLGYDGSAYSVSQARIEADAAETWTPAGHGVHLDFAVTPAGSTARTKRMRLDSVGNIALRDDLTAACKLDVGGPVRVGSYAKAALPPASAGAGQVIFVPDEADGAVLAFSDGSAWRRVTDRAVVS